MKRREFIKNLIAAQAGVFATRLGFARDHSSPSILTTGIDNNSTSTDGLPFRLNVFVHGAVAIVVDTKKTKTICLKAPKIDTHHYRAQAFTLDPSDPNNLQNAWTQDYEVNSEASHAVEFDRGGTTKLDVNIGENNRLAVDVTNLKSNECFWTVQMPLPDDIWPLRATPFNYFDDRGTGGFDTYHQNDMHYDQQCPIVYVLTYSQLSATTTVNFTGNNMAVPFDKNGVGRLHFYSDPIPTDCKPYPVAHLQMAIDALNNVFDTPLNLKLINSTAPNTAQGFDNSATLSKLQGVLACEERSIQERNCYKCSEIRALRTINTQYALAKTYIATVKHLQELGYTGAALKKFHRGFSALSNLGTRNGGGVNNKGLSKARIVPPLKPPSNCMPILALIK